MSVQDPVNRDIVTPVDSRYSGLLQAQAQAGAAAAHIQRAQRERDEPVRAQPTGGHPPATTNEVPPMPELHARAWGIGFTTAAVAFLLGAFYDVASGAHSPVGSLLFAVGCFVLSRIAFALDEGSE
jgi:hypothetical protein